MNWNAFMSTITWAVAIISVSGALSLILFLTDRYGKRVLRINLICLAVCVIIAVLSAATIVGMRWYPIQ